MRTYSGKEIEKRLVRPLLWSVIAAVAIYSGSVIASDLNAVGESFAKLGIANWAIILGLSLVNYGLRFFRWEMYLRRYNTRVPVLQSLTYYLGGFAFTTTPGKAGEAVRSLYLKRHGMAYVHSLAAFFAERFVDLIAMTLLALFAVLTLPEYQWPVVVITVLVLALLPLIHAKSFHAFLESLLEGLRSERIRFTGSRLVELLRSASNLLRSWPLYGGIALGFIAWGAEGVAFQVILHALDIDTSLGLAVGIYSVSVLAGALSFIPGGLGTTEAVMVLLLKIVGADTPMAVAATLICRLATLWFAVIIGGLMLVALDFSTKAVRPTITGD